MMDIFKGLEPDFTNIEKAMTRRFASHIPFVNQVSEYILFSGGKRIRPLLTLFSARLCNAKESQDIFDLSVIPEYLHAASLLHDDVIDGGELRRGKPAAYKIWGNKATVLVGDYLYAKAIELASGFNDVRISGAIAETVALMAEGEIIQLIEAGKSSFDKEIYGKIIHRKTAALISASCRIGALFADADEKKVKALARYGLNLGFAFQVVDDILDFTADAGELGKTMGQDISEGKITLPLAIAMESADEKGRESLLKVISSKKITPEYLGIVCDILDKTRAIDLARNEAENLINEACAGLKVFSDSESKVILDGLAHFVLSRRR